MNWYPTEQGTWCSCYNARGSSKQSHCPGCRRSRFWWWLRGVKEKILGTGQKSQISSLYDSGDKQWMKNME